MTDSVPYDRILEARLGLLEQAVDEVDKICDAKDQLARRLQEVQDFLKADKGVLRKFESSIRTHLTDTGTRVKAALEEESEDADEDFEATADADPDADVRVRSPLQQARTILDDAQDTLDRLREARVEAYSALQSIRQWSVADLDDHDLKQSAGRYRQLLTDIRKSPVPWKAFERELHGRGEQLFTRYLELLGGMAVRGFAADKELADERQALVQLMVQPFWSQSPPSLRVPNLLTRTEHVQLGYVDWNLWVLPLVGREAGIHAINSGRFNTDIPTNLLILCADVFAMYVVGPSYAAATIYLELDPEGGESGSVPDPVRAEVMMRMLPEMAEAGVHRDYLGKRAAELRASWTGVRTALGAPEVILDPECETAERFLAELRERYSDLAFPIRKLSDVVANSQQLADENESLTGVLRDPRSLLAAMWLARLANPGTSRLIHTRAREVATQSRPSAATASLSARDSRLYSRVIR
ncbi:MAG TPA: hypothetical protein VIT65_11475 [Microlunatus sp.]